jgi:hypothetical protein
MRLNGYFQNDLKNMRRTFSLSTFLLFVSLLICSFGCAPTASPGDGKQNSPDAASSDVPELTDEIIRERINDTGVWDVPEESGSAEPISWRFDEDEPKEIVVVEKKMDGTRATIVLDIKTRSAPNWRNPRSLAGQLRTEWELETGWALRQWKIKRTENVSMKYKNLPKPAAQNANR